MNFLTSPLAIVGLGYVGLPLAVEFGKQRPVLGFDINAARVAELQSGRDHTLECSADELRAAAHLRFSHDPAALKACQVFIVTVPTPVDAANRPDLTPLIKASQTVGAALKPGDVVIYESTVYPGATEEVCVPELERASGLTFNRDFFCGYSPERINPGDKDHRLPSIKKVTSGSTPAVAQAVNALYAQIITAGTHQASSIRVAEAAKVIENTQRDINIALMNELSLIFHRLGIDTLEVLHAAGTKWNFLPFRPGLVGGHCIGVDPYYLVYKAKELGYHAQIIDAGRFVNDSMGGYTAKQTVKKIIAAGTNPADARVLVMGATFKENVTDIRNSKVADVVKELQSFSCTVDVTDPHADAAEVEHEYGYKLAPEMKGPYDAIIVAVNHSEYTSKDEAWFKGMLKPKGVLVDLKGIFRKKVKSVNYWSL